MSHTRISQLLIETGAYKDLEKPAILTSGKLGIYYVNTEKIVQDGGEFNKYGDSAQDMILHALRMEEKNPTYKEVIDIVSEEVEKKLETYPSGLVAISGGQRRDWLFSGPVAYRLRVPHISLYKDNERIDVLRPTPDLKKKEGLVGDDLIEGAYVVHVSDLLTTGSSSYDPRKQPPTGWVKMLRDSGSNISDLFTVVTRFQGGEEVLNGAGISVTSFVQIDEEFLDKYSKQPWIAVKYLETGAEDWGYGYIQDCEIDDFVDAFSPENMKKDNRAIKFLSVYRGALRQLTINKWDELAKKVREKYGTDINSLSLIFSDRDE